MLNEEICKLREQLNESIINGQDYTITYKLSVELDELIAKYYRRDVVEDTKEEKSNISYLMV
ncbi:MAG: aspartyl-phosphate phosphatase Spo0E family protein [Clostridia bacterium]